MFSIFKKKSDLEKIIAKEGLENSTMGFSRAISQKLQNREIAYQFVLEEIEAASMGDAQAQAYARKSGILPTEYKGSLDNSRPEVDGPGGPQQLVLALCMQLQANPDLMVKFRIGILDKIMREYEFGAYAAKDDDANDDGGGFAPRADTRVAHITAHLLNLSRSNLQLVDTVIEAEQGEALVEFCAAQIPNNMFRSLDTKVVALMIMLIVAKNGVHHGEMKAACMLAMSVIWGAKKMEEDNYSLTEKERAVVTELEVEARTLLAEHRGTVDEMQARLWIATTLASEAAQLPTGIS